MLDAYFYPFAPGTRHDVASVTKSITSTLVGLAIDRERTGTNALGFAHRELFGPLGISDIVWLHDARGNNHGWGDMQLHPLDMARIGQLFLQRGRWNDRQIISERWVTNAIHAHVERTSNKDHYGYFWWVKGNDYPGMLKPSEEAVSESTYGPLRKW